MPLVEIGRSTTAPPLGSDVDVLRDFQGVIDLDAEIADRTLDLAMAKQELNGPQVAGSPIDEAGLGSAYRMCAESKRVLADAGDPLREQACKLTRGEAATRPTTAGEEVFARLPGTGSDECVDRLPRLLCDHEFDRPARPPLPHRSPVKSIAMGATSSTLRRTKSQARSLLSTARLKRARSRTRPASCSRVRIAQTCFGCRGGFGPMSLPLFQGWREVELPVGSAVFDIVDSSML